MNIVLAILLIGPTAVFMGGTIPVLANHIILKMGELGEKGSILYGINTLGAAIGAFAAGFWLPASYGLLLSYKIALALSFFISISAFILYKNP